MRLEDGSKLREFGRDGTRERKTEHQQFMFSPMPKSIHQATFEVVMINIQKPVGIFCVSGHWAITIPIHLTNGNDSLLIQRQSRTLLSRPWMPLFLFLESV
jgi:hypothetical protein